MGSGHDRATIAAGSLSQPKSDLSDFGRLMSRPNSGKPEFGWERGGVRGYKLSMGPIPLTPTLSPAGRGSPAVPRSKSVLSCLAASAFAIVASLLPALASAADELRVGVSIPAAVAFVPLQVGIDRGIFGKHGLDIKRS